MNVSIHFFAVNYHVLLIGLTGGAGDYIEYLEKTHAGMRRTRELDKLQSKTFLLHKPLLGYYLDP